MEFYDVHFSYIDNDTLEEHFVSVKEQGGGGLIPDGPAKPGFLYTIGLSNKGMPGLYRLELQVTKGDYMCYNGAVLGNTELRLTERTRQGQLSSSVRF